MFTNVGPVLFVYFCVDGFIRKSESPMPVVKPSWKHNRPNVVTLIIDSAGRESVSVAGVSNMLIQGELTSISNIMLWQISGCPSYTYTHIYSIIYGIH